MTQEGLTPGTQEMFRLVASLPDQLTESANLQGLDRAGDWRADCRRIILCGMGGSAIAADLVAPLLAGSGVSLTVWRDYGLPHWAAPGDLVVCSSYSGNTEETLSAAAAAGDRGLDRFVITTGGALGELADDAGLPRVTLPPGLPPRASLGYGLGTLVRLLGGWGLVPDFQAQLDSAVAALGLASGPRLAPVAGEPADDPMGHPRVGDLASALAGRMAVIYTAGFEAHAAGFRLRAQLNENSKVPACLAAFPELNHNDLEGWNLSGKDRGRFALVVLTSPSDDPRLAQRITVTRGLLEPEFDSVHEIVAQGDTPLARIMDLVQYGDFLSCHLACLRGADALPVERITRLKNELGGPAS
jgi:glucose/mannose-6-phosphate isomerase